MNERAGLLAGVGQQKLTRDIAYSLVSFGVLAVSGMVINLVITALRDAAALGVFNQSYAVYIMASQVATFGLHYSVLRHTALHEHDATQRGQCVWTAAVCALAGGLLVAMLLHACAGLLGRAFASEATGHALANAALGLALFPMNKVLLAHLNALRQMRTYALLQAVRYISIMVLVTVICASGARIEQATLALLAAEIVTCAAAASYLWRQGEFRHASFRGEWMRRHVGFGGKGLLAGMFAEFNSRVDVLLIGVFMSDRLVGIYSFAAMLADGMYNVLATVRLNFNPLLTRAVRDADWGQPRQLLVSARRYIMPGAAVLSSLLIAGFYGLATYLMPHKGLMEGLPSLCVLLAALTIVSSFVPFDNLLLVTGHPGYQTVQQLAMVSANVVFGALLLLPFGIVGVAAGTAVSYFVSIAVLLWMAQRTLHWNLLTNSTR